MSEKSDPQDVDRPDAGKGRKAIDEHGNLDQQKLKDNQDQLQVDHDDHKTDAMKKGDRGTFP